MLEMYAPMVNSPITELATAIDDTQTTIEVVDGSKLPDAPNLAMIGLGENTETILYTQKDGNVLSGVTRGFQGVAKAWPQGTRVARFFAAYDQMAIQENIKTLDQSLATHLNESVTDGVHGMGRIASQDYEEGTWTPELNIPGATYILQSGMYRKIGGMVFCTFRLYVSNISDQSRVNVELLGIPFVTSLAGHVVSGLGTWIGLNLPSGFTQVGISTNLTSQNSLFIYKLGSGKPPDDTQFLKKNELASEVFLQGGFSYPIS